MKGHDHGHGRDCNRCNAKGSVKTPSPLCWVLVGFAWAGLLLLGVCCALPIPLTLVLVPSWLAIASSVGPLARALVDAKCVACGVSHPRVAPVPEERAAAILAAERV